MSKGKKKSKKQILLIYNPIAGNPSDPTLRIDRAEQYLSDQGFVVRTAVEHPKQRAYNIAKKAVKEGYRTIVVMGGDGTIEAVIPALVGKKVRLGIFSSGTVNNLAKSLGIPVDLKSAAQLIADGCTRELDIGQVKVKKGKKKYLVEMAAVGLIADLLPDAQALYKRQWSRAGKALDDFIKYQPPEFTLTLDKESTIRAEAPLVTVSNTPSWGMTYLIAPEASMEDGLLDVNFYTRLNKVGVLTYFEAARDANPVDQPRIERYRARQIKIKSKPKQAVMVDGEALGSGTVKIKVRKGALRVITPETLGLAKETTPEEETLPAPIAPTPDEEREESAR